MKKRHRLSLDIPESLWKLLHDRARAEQRSITEIIRRQFEGANQQTATQMDRIRKMEALRGFTQ